MGSQISQLIQLCVLDDLDHIMKDKMGIKSYIRYMDDIKIIHHDKEMLKNCLKIIKEYLEARGLSISEKKTFIAPLKNGINFLGFTYFLKDTGFVVMRLQSCKISRERRKLKKKLGKIPGKMAEESYKSWKANAYQGTTYKLTRKMDAFFYYNKRKYERQP